MKKQRERLPEKEEQVMQCFWEHGPLFVREIVEMMPDPKPHVNTISTFVRSLESKGFLDHERLGSTYRYRPVVSREDYRSRSLGTVLRRLFDNSYISLVSALVADEKISTDELRQLIDRIEKEGGSKQS